MLSKPLITLATFLIAFSTTAQADQTCGTAVGNTIMGKVTLQCQKITGSASLTQTTMQGPLSVIGDLTANQAILTNIDVIGNVILENSTVTGTTHIVGKLEATNTNFKDTMQLDTLSATFTNSTTKNIEVKSGRQNQATFVYLNDGTIIDGDITFANGNGIIQTHNAKINGKIIGGKLSE